MARYQIELTEKDIAQIEIMAGLGLPESLMGAIIGVSHCTFRKQKKTDPRVQEAIDRGIAKARYAISRTLYSLAVDDKNLAAIIHWERSRAGVTYAKDEPETEETDNEQQVFVYIPDNERDETETETKVVKTKKIRLKKRRIK